MELYYPSVAEYPLFFLISFLLFFPPNVCYGQEIIYSNPPLYQPAQVRTNGAKKEVLLLGALQTVLGLTALSVGPVVFSANLVLPLLYYWVKSRHAVPPPSISPQPPTSEVHPEWLDFDDWSIPIKQPTPQEQLLEELKEQVIQDLQLYEYDTDNICYRFARERLYALEQGIQVTCKEYIAEQRVIKAMSYQENYSSLNGMAIQHMVHQEILATLTELSAHSNLLIYHHAPRPIDKGQVKSLAVCARELLDEACVHNREQRIAIAMHLVDVGVNIAQLVSIIHDYALLPIAQGTLDAVHDIAQLVAHPIDTAVNMAKGITRISVAIARIVVHTNQLAVYELTGNKEQAKKIDAQLQQQLEPFIKWAQYAADMPAPEMVREGTRLTWSFVLSTKGAQLLSRIFGAAHAQLSTVGRAAYGRTIPVPAWLTNVELSIANRTSRLLEDVVSKGQKALQLALEEMQSLPSVQFLQQECQRLSGLFDKKLPGFAQLEHLFIEFDYEHLFIPKLTANGKRISGFHHDFKGLLESTGIIKLRNIVQKEHEFYEAEVWFDGIWDKRKTFFPKQWTREKVMQKIEEAYKEALQANNKIKKQGDRFEVIGLIKEQIEIRIIIDENAKGITQYPIFKV